MIKLSNIVAIFCIMATDDFLHNLRIRYLWLARFRSTFWFTNYNTSTYTTSSIFYHCSSSQNVSRGQWRLLLYFLCSRICDRNWKYKTLIFFLNLRHPWPLVIFAVVEYASIKGLIHNIGDFELVFSDMWLFWTMSIICRIII